MEPSNKSNIDGAEVKMLLTPEEKLQFGCQSSATSYRPSQGIVLIDLIDCSFGSPTQVS